VYYCCSYTTGSTYIF
nr:immunoglobulin light chain junction region [Macaca mulatta]